MPFNLYILFSQIRNRYYIGHTGDNIAERIRKHNTDHNGFTGKTNDWILKYQETAETKSAAIKRELKIKRWKSRKRIEQLISVAHPES